MREPLTVRVEPGVTSPKTNASRIAGSGCPSVGWTTVNLACAPAFKGKPKMKPKADRKGKGDVGNLWNFLNKNRRSSISSLRPRSPLDHMRVLLVQAGLLIEFRALALVTAASHQRVRIHFREFHARLVEGVDVQQLAHVSDRHFEKVKDLSQSESRNFRDREREVRP